MIGICSVYSNRSYQTHASIKKCSGEITFAGGLTKVNTLIVCFASLIVGNAHVNKSVAALIKCNAGVNKGFAALIISFTALFTSIAEVNIRLRTTFCKVWRLVCRVCRLGLFGMVCFYRIFRNCTCGTSTLPFALGCIVPHLGYYMAVGTAFF